MATLSELVNRFITDERPDTQMLDNASILAQGIAATWYYAGYAAITSEPSTVDGNVELSLSEWALIRPLFLLYTERETAIQLEASRMMGIELFGRSVSEVNVDITAIEADLSHRAFYRDIINL